MPVKTFKTNVDDNNLADLPVIHLQRVIPDFLINFDLEDTDNILCIDGNREVSSMVIRKLAEKGIDCKPLS